MQRRSSLFDTLAPRSAIGSHTLFVLFVTRIVNEERWADGPQLFHVAGLFQHYRRSQGRPLS